MEHVIEGLIGMRLFLPLDSSSRGFDWPTGLIIQAVKEFCNIRLTGRA
jgi:hypothetical protein